MKEGGALKEHLCDIFKWENGKGEETCVCRQVRRVMQSGAHVSFTSRINMPRGRFMRLYGRMVT